MESSSESAPEPSAPSGEPGNGPPSALRILAGGIDPTVTSTAQAQPARSAEDSVVMDVTEERAVDATSSFASSHASEGAPPGPDSQTPRTAGRCATRPCHDQAAHEGP